MRRFSRCTNWACLLLLGMLAGGCAETQYVMQYGLEETAAEEVPRWPAPPEVPRFMYAGELTGEGNYVVVERESRSAAEKAFAWIVGLTEAVARPRRLQRPSGGMVDGNGRIYVTDVGLGAVLVFDETAGKLYIWDEAGPFENFLAPVGIAAGRGGEVLVTDADLGTVIRLSAAGDPIGRFGGDVLKRPTGIARDPERGWIFVSDTQAHDIKVFDDDGLLIDTLGRRGERLGEFNYPTHLSWRHDRLYVTDTMNTRIQVLDVDGDVKRAFGERGLLLGNLVRPKGVASDSDGNIYVVESLFDHLLVFDETGRLLLPIGGEGGGPGQFYLPGGVWTDGRDRVFVADTFNGRVSIFQYLGSS